MLTIATVVFNDPIGLKKTMDSVRAHKDKGAKIEFIIADGGSEQSTLNVIDKESDVIDNFLIGPDSGIYHGMNRLLEAANGISILFINSGDILSEYIDLVSLMESYELDKKNHFGKLVQRYNNNCYIRPKMASKKLDIKNISHQAFFVPKKIYKSISYDLNYSVSADKLWIKECIRMGEAVYIDEIISVFELGGVSNSSNFKSLISKFKENTSFTKKSLQLTKLILKMFCSQAFYYRIIYYFKYKHSRCEDVCWSTKS